MTVKDIAIVAASILQADDVLEFLEQYGANEQDEPPKPESDVKTLVACVNLALAESAADTPVLHTATAVARNGYIALDDEVFDGELASVRAVTFGGKNVRFKFDSRGINVDRDGEYGVVYTVVQPDKGLTDEPEVGAGLDKTVLAYLSARDYCLVTGRTDEASVWDQRYNAELEKHRLLRRARLPRRRFS